MHERVLVSPTDLAALIEMKPVVLIETNLGSWNEWSRDPSLPIEEGLPY